MSALHIPSRPGSRILDLAAYLPEQVLTNDELAALYPDWPAEKILDKTGIGVRHVAAPGQTAGDLAYEAARNLFAQGQVAPAHVDFIILCTQAPDYVLPTTACVLQHRLGIATSAGAFDINLGCSGFVYGLSVAKGLVETGAARCVLLLTADTYSRYIHPQDKSVRTLFGDGAAATAIVADDGAPSIGPFVFGTDGSGAGNLIVPAGGFRRPGDADSAVERTDGSGNVRTDEHLYMNGAEVMAFSLREVPKAVDALLDKAGRTKDDIGLFVLHQANKFMLEALRKRLKVPEEKLPVCVRDWGNTVSSSIPLALIGLRNAGRLPAGTTTMLVGFGVGYSWAACLVNF
ncbi:ketoacyl-ACP synthase III [Pseudoduganella plicata]|uniref:3-oxoacyl-ACP synthase n=1 Tax=Pseudoduganella plicata TaxID=321984 RepID=A0A4P7BC39_9BURK|nr:ketoacyl-ACP synthase III [Pseudoduganella plicata]QBQ35663.1 ketoacyl-ACP synthase III [Pseudoduganella plicata]GGY96220.1 3-oxoacyl-ACP synthase [Pseudoduganella plicata]